jgi:hypothetical protein
MLAAATAVDGLLAGASLNQSIKQFPARYPIGARAFSAYSRASDRANGIVWYDALGIDGALLTVPAAGFSLLALPLGEAAPVLVAGGLAVAHSATTARAAKQEPSEDVYDVVLQDPRDRARAVLPEPQTPARQTHLPRRQRLEQGHRCTTDQLSPSEPSGRWAMDSQSIQGIERGAYVTLGRLSLWECGMAYGTRVLWQRSPIVVGGRKGNVPPSSTGKPTTGRRGSRRKPARAHGATPMGGAGVNEAPTGSRYVRCGAPTQRWGSFVNAANEDCRWSASTSSCSTRRCHASWSRPPRVRCGPSWIFSARMLINTLCES